MQNVSHPQSVDILMYHSISDGPGPTCISPATFRQQLNAIEQRGFQVVSLGDFVAWQRGQLDLPERSIVLTFDDGFADFAEAAFPELQSRGWTATVFLPTDLVGRCENWPGQNHDPRPLMDWSQIASLADEGIEFGAHTLTHADLTALNFDEACEQICKPRESIERHLGKTSMLSFAPPYGRSNQRVRDEIRKWYCVSVGVTLQRAGRHSDLFDLPRLEMYYFQNANVWDSYLSRRAEWYLTARRALRKVRRLINPDSASNTNRAHRVLR